MAGVTFELAGEICVVTGGGSGIGRALCNACVEAGAAGVVAIDFDLASAEETIARLPKPKFVGEFKSAASNCAIFADCGKNDDVAAAIEKIETEIGPIGSFMANAGIGGGPPGIGVTDESWNLMQGVNVMQHVYVNRHLVPRMIARGGGNIVITASAAGLLTQVGSFPYAVTKAAAVACAEWLSVTHGADGIAVNCLCPQAVATNLGVTSAKVMGMEQTLANPSAEKDGDVDDASAGVAGGDGVLTAKETAEEVLRCIAEGIFLVLPHKEVRTYMERKAQDTDRWVTGMRRLNNAFGENAVDEAREMAKKYGYTAPKL